MRFLNVIYAVFFVFAGCSNIEEPGALNLEAKKQPDQEIWNGRIEITENGRLKSVVQAGYVQYFEKKKLNLLSQGVKIDFYNKLGQHTSVLTSDRARIEEKSDIFTAEGNVVVKSDSGAVLRTERLYWDKETERILSDTLVILTTDLDSLRGFNFEADEDLTSWEMKNPTGQTFRRLRE